MQRSSVVMDTVQVYKLKTVVLEGHPERDKLGVGTTFLMKRLDFEVFLIKNSIYFIIKIPLEPQLVFEKLSQASKRVKKLNLSPMNIFLLKKCRIQNN